jgi:hypothetical protein
MYIHCHALKNVPKEGAESFIVVKFTQSAYIHHAVLPISLPRHLLFFWLIAQLLARACNPLFQLAEVLDVTVTSWLLVIQT